MNNLKIKEYAEAMINEYTLLIDDRKKAIKISIETCTHILKMSGLPQFQIINFQKIINYLNTLKNDRI